MHRHIYESNQIILELSLDAKAAKPQAEERVFMTVPSTWETIYAQGGQLNRYPFSDCVSFFMRRWARGVPNGFHALDVGCGSGVHSKFFASHGSRVSAFDFSPSAIEAAKHHCPDSAISYQTASFDSFDPGEAKFDFVFDRLSTTHSSMDQVARFYQRLRASLAPGAQVFWQGFHWGNSGRNFGVYEPEQQRWNMFSEGVFRNLGPTVFFKESDLERVFEGYQFDSKRILSAMIPTAGIRIVIGCWS